MDKNNKLKIKDSQEKIDLLYKVVMLFTIGCFVGVVFETILSHLYFLNSWLIILNALKPETVQPPNSKNFYKIFFFSFKNPE